MSASEARIQTWIDAVKNNAHSYYKHFMANNRQTPIARPLFQDNTGKPTSERLN